MKDSDEKHTADGYLGRILAGVARPFFYRSGVRALLGVPDSAMAERGVPSAASRVVNMYSVRRPHNGKATGQDGCDDVAGDRKPEQVDEPERGIETGSSGSGIVRTTDIRLPGIQEKPYELTPRFELLPETMEFAESTTLETPDTGVLEESHSGYRENLMYLSETSYAVAQPACFPAGVIRPDCGPEPDRGRVSHLAAHASPTGATDVSHVMQPVPDSPSLRIARAGLGMRERKRCEAIPDPIQPETVRLEQETGAIHGMAPFHHSPPEPESEAAAFHDGRNRDSVREAPARHFSGRPSMAEKKEPRFSARHAFWQRRYVRRMHVRMFR